MAEPSLEDLFARFRRDHALEALAEVFDRTAPQFLDVARHLSAHPAEAEDLVQATFLAAIESAPRFEEGRALVPWLVGILVHKARRGREGRRIELDACAEHLLDVASDPSVRAESRELRGAVGAALARLSRSEREVLQGHLVEGRPAGEIARRLGRPPGTVRVQIHRGLRRLRRLLPASLALGAGAALAPRGLAAVRAEVLRSGRAAVSPSALAIGGMLVSKKLALGAAALVAALSVWWTVRGYGEADVVASPAATTVSLTGASAAETELVATGATADRAPSSDPVGELPLAEPYGALAVELVWWDGTPAAGIPLCFYPWEEPQPTQAFQLRFTDAEGRARVERIRAGMVLIEAARSGDEGNFQTDVEPGVTTATRLTLPRGCDVVGRVLDERGAPVGGAQLWVRQDVRRPGHPVERAEADGSFRIRSVIEGFGVLATADERGSSDTASWEELQLMDEHTRRVELRLRGESAELAGSVRDADGKPIAGARISVRCFNNTERVVRSWPNVVIASDEEGAFRLGGLHHGAAEVRVAAAGFARKHEVIGLAEHRTAHLAVVLDCGFRVRGSVKMPDDTPIRGASVRAEPHDLGVDDDLYSLFTATDEEGRYLLEYVPAGEAVLAAYVRNESGPSTRAQTRISGRAGDERTWDVVFGAGPSIRGRARDESGLPLAGWTVQAIPDRGSRAIPSHPVVTDERGEFVVPDLSDAGYIVSVHAPEDEHEQMARARIEGVVPGGDEIELVVCGERTPSAFVLGRVLDPDGKPVRPKQMWARRNDRLSSVGNPTWSEDERFRIGPMLAGEYELSVTVEGFPGFHPPAFEIAEGEERDLGDLAMPRPGRAQLTLRDPDGNSVPQPVGVFLMVSGRYAHRLSSTDGLVFESDAIYPGTCVLWIMSGSVAPERQVPIEIRPGETTFADIRLSAGRSVRFDFAVPEGERLPRRVRLEVRDASGAIAFEQEVIEPQGVMGKELMLAVSALTLGRFDYAAYAGTELAATGSFEVVAGPEPQQQVTIALVRTR